MVKFHFELFPTNGRIGGHSAGDIVAGLLTVDFEQRTTIKGIKATLSGRTKLSFIHGSVIYKMIEPHFTFSLYFLCDNEDGAEVVVEQKAYQFPFLFPLPPGIPSSFKGALGSVEYLLTAEVMKGLFVPNPSTTYLLTVHGAIDLNQLRIPELSIRSFGLNFMGGEEILANFYSNSDPDSMHWLSLPTEVTKEKRFWKFYDMKLTFIMAKTGFVAGEDVHFKAIVTNNVWSSIKLSFQIFQETKYVFTKGEDKHEEEIYASVFQHEGPVVGSWETKTWNVSGDEIKVPPRPLTNLGGGNIIGVNYCAQVILKTRGLSKLVGSIPIFIGSTPLENSEEEPFSHPARLIQSTSFVMHCGFWVKYLCVFIWIPILALFGYLVYRFKINS